MTGAAAREAGQAAAGGATVFSCQDIRLCALDCADDAAVMTNCKSKGSADAQAAFQALYDCTKNTGGCDARQRYQLSMHRPVPSDPPCQDLVFTLRQRNIADPAL